jgi:hypothetical protein
MAVSPVTQYDWYKASLRIILQALAHLDSIQFGHLHVQQKHIGFETVEFRPCSFAVPGGEYGEAFQQKQSFQPDQAGLMVIRNQNCLRHRLEGEPSLFC